MTVHELLSISDDSFIDALYWTILGREVDEKGREHHWRRLARGDLRADIIYDLFKSKESQRRKSHRDLFALPDEAFVKAAYRRLLGREADPEGLQSYCDLLKRRGRARVLKDIKSTAEFQNARVYWPYTDVRLKAFIRKQRVQRLVRRLAPGAENTGKVLRQINFNVRHDLKALDAVVMSLRQDVASLGIQTRDLRRAMQRRDVRHAPAPSRPWRQPSFEQAAPKAVINSTFEALQRRMAREISHGVFSNQLVGQAKIDDFLSGAGPIEASPEGAIRWVNSLAIASLKVTGPSMHVIAAGVFERRAVQFSVNGEYLGEFVFEPGKTNVTISVEEWKGEDIALGIQPLGLFAPRSRGVSADHRELGLLLHSIYFN